MIISVLKEKSRIPGLFFFIALFLCACSEEKNEDETTDPAGYYKITGEAQGTTYAITYHDSLGRNLKPQIDDLLIAFDNSISSWNSSSLVSEFNGYDEVQMDSFLLHTWLRSKEIYKRSNGAFNPGIWPLVELWGFGLSKRSEVDSSMVDSVRAMIDIALIDTVHHRSKFRDRLNVKLVDRGSNEIEFNAIAQGYSVDLVGDFLESRGIKDFMIQIGGEILCRGKNPKGDDWQIGIDHPDNTMEERTLWAIVNVANKAVATSGSYRKYYEKNGKVYSHTIDPRTGYPVEHSLLSVTVMADDCESADAFATVFMVLGVEESKRFLKDHNDLGLDVFLIYKDATGDWETFTSPGMMQHITEFKSNDAV